MMAIKEFLFVETPDRSIITMRFLNIQALLANTLTNHHQILINYYNHLPAIIL